VTCHWIANMTGLTAEQVYYVTLANYPEERWATCSGFLRHDAPAVCPKHAKWHYGPIFRRGEVMSWIRKFLKDPEAYLERKSMTPYAAFASRNDALAKWMVEQIGLRNTAQ